MQIIGEEFTRVVFGVRDEAEERGVEEEEEEREEREEGR